MSLALPEALFFTGIDWGGVTHAVCVMDAAGKIIAELREQHFCWLGKSATDAVPATSAGLKARCPWRG